MSTDAVAASGFVEPAYARRSLGDVVPAIAAALGRPLEQTPSGLVLPDAASYVVFLVDGLGAQLLRRYAHAAPYLSSLLAGQEPGTSGVPSTTATSLTSFGTGMTPGGHGLVGYTSRIPGTDALLNALQWSKDVDPHEWQPHPTAFQRLRERGVTVTVVNKREFQGTGLTEAAQRGAEYVGADKVGERIAGALVASAEPGSITYLYDGDLDWTGHRHGVASSPWLQQLSMIDAEAEQLRDALPPSVRLVVVADHGMIDSPPESRIDVDDHAESSSLRDGLALLGGEARFRHLYCQRGAVASVADTWAEVLGDRATVLTRDQAVARGWFGEVTPAVRPRLGDVIVAAHGDFAVMASGVFPYEAMLVGLHGSLTADEMLIPILVD
ncbi:MAG TPA: nucleotide pyrophosphatase/phosphodiesterase family protein [Nocardioides sp.]|uniref:alkaline phosphatase family protein n=1 Tax=Nocardioides sp. TaxID=35761 RepID=UPI002ED7CF2A